MLDGKPIRVVDANDVRFWMCNQNTGKVADFPVTYDTKSSFLQSKIFRQAGME